MFSLTTVVFHHYMKTMARITIVLARQQDILCYHPVLAHDLLNCLQGSIGTDIFFLILLPWHNAEEPQILKTTKRYLHVEQCGLFQKSQVIWRMCGLLLTSVWKGFNCRVAMTMRLTLPMPLYSPVMLAIINECRLFSFFCNPSWNLHLADWLKILEWVSQGLLDSI